MFGYITIDKPELKMREYDVFQGYYCGLCKTLKAYSEKSRFLLSYDCVFLYLLSAAIAGDEAEIRQENCIAHPIKKHYVIRGKGADYAAAMNILLSYRKFRDDVQDEKSTAAKAASVLFRRDYKKAKKKYPEIAAKLEEGIAELSEKENSGCIEIDEVADTFAKILGLILKELDPVDAISLYEMGYSLGRWLYLVDAYDDLESDREKNRYNVFLNRFGDDKEAAKAAAEYNLYASANAAVRALSRLELLKNKGIIENIIMDSIHKTTKRVLNGGKNGSL